MSLKLHPPRHKEAGFTLIELLTVIVIIGILAAIAIPIFTSQKARAQDAQTISDVRNIAVQAETLMADPTKTYDDVTKANIDFASSKNVSWNISGKSSLGGYCIVAKNTAGKKYTTDATALTYDSAAGGVGQSGKACSGSNIPTLTSSNNGSSYSSPYGAAIAADSPTGFWQLNETSGTSAKNVAGNTNSATFNNVSVGTVAGPFNNGDTAPYFNGTNAYISLPGTFGGLSSYTVEAWVKTDGPTGNLQSIVEPSNISFFHFQMGSSGNNGFAYNNGGSSYTLPIISDQLQGWHHVAMTATPGYQALYVDGNLMGSATTSYSTITPTSLNDLMIGRGYGGGRYFKGSIAQVAIFDKALTQTQIKAHYNAR